MTKALFVLSAAMYWFSFLFRFVLWTRPLRTMELLASFFEKAGMLSFTGALVYYINALQVVNGEVHAANYDRPVSFLLFAWAVCAAQMVTEVAYNNTQTSVFADFWTAGSLSVSATGLQFFHRIFTSDLEWLSFHRLCFLLGYAFCALAFPLVFRYLRVSLRVRHGTTEEKTAAERSLWRVDRMGYRMVLWALPLLTAGVITEALLLIEAHQFPAPEVLWTSRRESLLALTAWFLCGIYLHTRLFFGWRNLRSAGLYLAGLLVILSAHLGQSFLGRTP